MCTCTVHQCVAEPMKMYTKPVRIPTFVGRYFVPEINAISIQQSFKDDIMPLMF